MSPRTVRTKLMGGPRPAGSGETEVTDHPPSILRSCPVTTRDLVRQEVDRGVGHLVRVHQLAGERLLAPRVGSNGQVAGCAPRHRRRGQRRSDGVDPDPVGRVGRRHRRHQGGRRALRRGVGMGREELGCRVGRGHAAHQQDRAAGSRAVRLLGEHLADHRPAGERLAAQVDLEGPVPALAAQLVDRSVAEAPATPAGDREQAVDPPEPLHGGGDRPVRLGLDREVGSSPGRAPTRLDELFGERPRMLRRARHHEHVRALGRESTRAGRRDPGRTGDQADPVAESVHPSSMRMGRCFDLARQPQGASRTPSTGLCRSGTLAHVGARGTTRL